MTWLPALSEAAVDRRLQPRDLSVYLVLHTELDVRQFRPVKHRWLAQRVGLCRESVLRALGRLLAHGYLDQGPPDGQLQTYRLCFSPTPRESQRKRRPPPARRASGAATP